MLSLGRYPMAAADDNLPVETYGRDILFDGDDDTIAKCDFP